MNLSTHIIRKSRQLAKSVDGQQISGPVTHIYNPLIYARTSHELYVKKFANSKKRVVFLGMNPGPFGMAQTGVPFGEISFVRDWMGITAPVKKPLMEHPKRPIEGFECSRSEVSGTRLWGLFKDQFASAEIFFKDHYVSNYCPLLFLNERGSNVIPEKITKSELTEIYLACDHFLTALLKILQPEFLVGVGNFAYKKGQTIVSKLENDPKYSTTNKIQIVKILHPSPASPAANRGWDEAATKQLQVAGIW